MITINWGTKVISIPKADLTLVQATPTEIREMDLNWFHLQLRDKEDDEEGMSFPLTHTHNSEVILGGLTYARVIEMINGYTVTFEDDQYAVNLVGANSNVADVVNVNQVSVRSANAAGLISNQAIEYSSFNGGVTIDIINGQPGTIFPSGSPLKPVDNLADAMLIAQVRGLKKLYIIESMEGANKLNSGTNLSDFIIEGRSKSRTVIEIDTSADTTGCVIRNATIYGILDGQTFIENCNVGNLVYFNGSIENSGMYGTIYLDGDADAVINNCITIDQDSPPVIDMGGNGQSLSMPNYSGIVTIKNLNDVNAEVFIGLNAGYAIFDSTISNGLIIISGVGEYIDNSTGSTIFSTTSLINKDSIAFAVSESGALTTGKFLALK